MSWLGRLFGRTPKPVDDDELPIDPDPELPARLPPRVPAAPVRVARDEAQEAAIEAALDRDPDAVNELEVYGDWLGTQGDPRGELIAMQVKLERVAGSWDRPHPPRTIAPLRRFAGPLASDADALIARHRMHFLGEALVRRSTRQRPNEVEWHAGYWRTLRYAYDDEPAQRTREKLAAKLSHPSARFLRELRIGTTSGGSLAAAVSQELPATLRTLYVGDFMFPDECELSWLEIGDASVVYARTPRLEQLVIQGANIQLGNRVELPRLRSLELITTSLPPASLRAIAASTLPELETLIVWTGIDDDEPTSAEVAPLLAASFPNLRHLGIVNCNATDAVVDALLRGSLLANLRTLDLSLGTLTPAGARALVLARDRLGHLESIDLSGNLLDDETVPTLRTLAPNVALDDQRAGDMDEGMRYVAISE